MKTIIAFLLVTIAISQVLANQDWEAYKSKYNKHYTTQEEDQFREKIFLENKKIVEEHNIKYEKGEVSFKMGLNQFSDWTKEEFQKILGTRPGHQNGGN